MSEKVDKEVTSEAPLAFLASHADIGGDSGIPIRFRTLSIKFDENAQAAANSRSWFSSRRKVAKDENGNPITAADAIRSINVHLHRPEDVFTKFSTSPIQGLETLAVERRAKLGKNKISPPPTHYARKTAGYVFGGFNFLMWIAFIVTIISYEPLGGSNPAPFNLGVAFLLLFVIIVSSIFYAFVDWNASRIMQSIRNLVSEDATVIRNGVSITIPAADVVVGDLVSLSLGNRVPADIRLTSCSSDVKFDRSLLTGEVDPVSGAINSTDKNPLETKNLAFSSTFVVQGTAQGVVFAIGDDTVIGRIVNLSGTQKLKTTTIQKELNIFTTIISCLAAFFFVLSMVIYEVWIKEDHPGYETVSGAIANALGCLTAFVPQGLPVCVALSLTIVARRMAARKVLVKNLATIETLGCMSVLCTDKTGTLTVGKMSVQHYGFFDAMYNADDQFPPKALSDIHQVAHLCNGASFDPSTAHLPISERKTKGDSTDTAILKFAETIGAGEPMRVASEKIFEIAFNSKNKWMLTITKPRGASQREAVMMVKGAPDVLIEKCSHALKADGTVTPIDQYTLDKIAQIQEEWSSQGERVLLLCRRPLEKVNIPFESTAQGALDIVIQSEIRDLVCVGLVGIRDGPREDVPEALKTIRRAGVRVFMVTGDFVSTAQAIARQVGLVTASKIDSHAELREHVKGMTSANPVGPAAHLASAKKTAMKPDLELDSHRAIAIVGNDILSFGESDWDVIFGLYSEIVFARTTPEQKLKIVEEAQKRGDNVVAVTGDGVNDAPAMKAADIGVAMGSGSDVAKDAAAMILMNNDFASICVAIENGRLVFDNLKKVILYLMPAGTYTEFIAVILNVFFGMQIPLNSYLQVFFSIFNDVSMSISLMFEKPEADLMLRKPRNARTDRLTDWRFFLHIYGFIGLMFWISTLSCFFIFMKQNGISASSLVFAFDGWGYSGDSLQFVLNNSPPSPDGVPYDITNSTLIGGLDGQTTLTQLVFSGNSVYYICLLFLQFGGVLATRNRRMSIFNSNPLWGPRKNLLILAGMAFSLSCGFLNVFTPGIQSLFGTGLIPVEFWFLPLAFAFTALMMDELRKLIVRTYPESLIAKCAW
ncbi:hypothetical protein HK100_003558 [Physocladia obscura]|uniref:Cation-transporting P-type ATPase N-terminal domain-containing protein n=1 Tax=Physocladia obscura TaxID=109957 RepID=A0AAD5XJR7_9FUNG|nr:hypothetical protein HK100_003558 [Physocladia obscura]